ncbi:hypothetical protein DFQ28_008208 [Apophysomyces sp. BC1034]|nr:hypothetical protein DFQ30_007702 [Apophysomyces sp. BC1015]KAG0181959.1 hypothetical protein DFQ29_006356 [Apophysomyces sp. BC1021]KAG0192701.1 hypothetical protein DFQ28_008208 [Apophysomyces sp. BC1034]
MADDLCEHCFKALGAFDYTAANKLTAYILKSLNSLYSSLAEDVAKEISMLDTGTSANSQDKLVLLHIMTALIELCKVRLTLINIYQSIAAQSSEAVTEDLTLLSETCEKAQLDERLNLLGIGVQKEINILSLLLKAREAIKDYAFQDTCIALFMCKQDLTEWKRLCQLQDFPKKSSARSEESRENSTWRFSLFGGPSENQKQGDNWPHTIRWQAKYLDNLTARMTLYFNTILLSKENIVSEDDPEKALWKGIKIDYHDQICTFRRRFGAHNIGLVYEVTAAVPFHPQGYVCSKTSYEAPQGIHSFPFIYCHPSQPPRDHLPNIISMIQGCKNKLADPKGGPVYFFDSKIASTYYLMRVDEHVVMVIIYLDRHVHCEPTTAEFMTKVVTSLRGSSVIGELVKTD